MKSKDGGDPQNSPQDLHLQNLEERVLYSAVPVPVDMVEMVENPDMFDQSEIVDPFESSSQGMDAIADGLDQFFAEEADSSALDLSESVLDATEIGSDRFELVVVDRSVDGFQELVDDIVNRNTSSGVNYEIAFIDSNSDGFSQLSQILADQSGEGKAYDALHLVTHGSDASLNIGSTQVNSANLDQFADEFSQWQSVLTQDADFLIYGCDVAETELGVQFVEDLAELTGADVAASDDITGHSTLGGDWHFEVIVGQIETQNAFTSQIQTGWMFSLQDTTGESGGATGRSIDVNVHETIVQVFTQDLGNGTGEDIFYQITDENGVQDAVQVNTDDPTGAQRWASVAIDNDGDFVVVWTDELGGGDQGVFAKYYAADGSLIRDEFRIDPVGSNGNDASVGIDAVGNFVVAWEGSGAQDSDGIYAQRFDTTGTEVGSTFLVNSVARSGLTQGNADVAVNNSGQFVIAWDDANSPFFESNIFARIFDDSTGFDSQEEIIANINTQVLMDPSVSINSSGNFAITYTTDANQFLKDGGNGTPFEVLLGGIFTTQATGLNLETFTFDGNNLARAEVVNNLNIAGNGEQHRSSVTVLDNNEVVVAWEGEGNGDAEGVFFQEFDLFSGARLLIGGDQLVDPDVVDGFQGSVSLASNGNDFVFGFNDNDALALNASFNYAPQTQGSTIAVTVGLDYTLSLSDFGYTDALGDPLDHVVFDSVPNSGAGQGQLLLNGAVLNPGGIATRAQIENGDLQFRTTPDTIGVAQLVNFRASDGVETSQSSTLQFESEFSDSLLFSFQGTQQLGSDSFDSSQVVGLTGTDLQLGTPTQGELYSFFDFGLEVDAFHLVDSTTIIDAATPITLNPGDVLFSIEGTSNSIPGISVAQPGDILLFQPGPSGQYDATGSFFRLGTFPGNAQVRGLTLVESDTTIGDTMVTEGSILLLDGGTNIQLVTNSSGVASIDLFFDATQIGINSELNGLELIEFDVNLGGVQLSEGTLLLATNNDSIGIGDDGSLNSEDNDIIALDIELTEIEAGNSSANGTVLFDASTLGLSGGEAGDLDAIAIEFTDTEQNVENIAPFNVTEGGTFFISSTQLLTSDVESAAADIVYTISSSPTAGTVLLSGVPTSSFTQQDINFGRVSYQHDTSESPTDRIELSVNDEFGDATDITLNINVSPINDEQVLVVNETVVVDEGQPVTIDNTVLQTTDVDNSAGEIVYTITGPPVNGTILVNGNPELTFTQTQIDNGDVSYEHAGGENTADSINFLVNDGLGASSFGTLNIQVNPTNDAPFELHNEVVLFEQNSTANLIASTALHYLDDDSSPQDVVYTVTTDVSNGNSLWIGTELLDVGSEFTQQQINDDLLRYTNGGAEVATDSFAFSVSDGLVSVDGVFEIEIKIINDAPILNFGVLNIDEDTSGNVISNSVLNAQDPDDSAAEIFYRLRGVPNEGSIFNAGSLLTMGDRFTQEDVNLGLITYDHTSSVVGNDVLQLSLEDGLESGVVPQDFDLVFNIRDVNEAAVVVTTDVPVLEGATSVITTSHLNAIDPDIADTPGELTYRVVTPAGSGNLLLNNSVLALGQTFTQLDVDLGRLSYQHDGSETGFDSIELVLADGMEDSVAAQNVTLQITVASTNDDITHLADGIEINSVGEDVYFEAVNGDQIFGGLDEFTYEISFASTSVGEELTLASYRSPADTGADDDAVRIALLADGSLNLVVNGSSVVSNALDFSQLLDGSRQNLAVYWDNTNGSWEIHVNGERTDHGFGLATGENIRNGGNFVIGHEQDSVDGGYSDTNEFKGTLYDVRVWDEQRSTAEIDGNQFTLFDETEIPNGLIANWQFDGLGAGGVVADVAGSNDLILNRVNSLEFDAVRNFINVDENSANGTIVGTVVPVDIEHIEDLVSDGSFTGFEPPIDGNFLNFPNGSFLGDWEVTQGDVDLRGELWEPSPSGGVALDLVGNSHGTISQTLETVPGQTYTLSFELSAAFIPSDLDPHTLDVVVDGNATEFSFERPPGWDRNNLLWEHQTLTFTATSTSTVLELSGTSGAVRGALVSDISVVRQDAVNQSANKYNLLVDANGRFEIDENSGQITIADSSQIDFESAQSYVVEVEVEDEDGQTYSQEVVIEINNVNESFAATESELAVDENSTSNVISITEINVIDEDMNSEQLVYTLVSEPANGSVILDGDELAPGDTFTHEQIELGQLTYDHDGTETISDSIQFSLSDGVHQQTVDLDVVVNPVNDAPVLTTGTFSFSDVLENNTNPIGNTVADLLNSSPRNPVSDADGTNTGIAVIGIDDSNGQWEFSIDGGATWQTFASQGVANGAVNDVNGLLLEASSLIRFVPDDGYDGPVGDLSFRLWDQSDSLAAGDVADVSFDDRTDSVSQSIGSASVEIESGTGVVNSVPGMERTAFEQPVVFSTANSNPITVTDSDPTTDSNLRVTLTANDAILNLNPAALGSVMISSTNPDGTGEIILGGTESAINAALDGLTVTPNSDFEGAVSVSVTTDFQFGNLFFLDEPGPGISQDLVADDPERGTVLELENGEFLELSDASGNSVNAGASQSLTLGGFVNIDPASGIGEVFSIGDSVTLSVSPGPEGVTAGFSDPAGIPQETVSSINIHEAGWHHVAFTIDEATNTQTLYLDGVVVAQTNHAEPIAYDVNAGTFVGNNPNGTLPFNGLLDDLFIYDRALSANEIEALQSGQFADTDTIEVVVESNFEPIAVRDDLGTFLADTATTIRLSELILNDSDAENDTLTISSFTQPSGGTVTMTINGDLLFTPDDGFSGFQEFEYTISDGHGNESSTEVSFVVNDRPVGVNDTFEVVRDTVLQDNVFANDSVDSINSGLSYSLVSRVDNNNGILDFRPDGSFEYTPAPGFFGVETFEYLINDGLENSDVVVVEITVLAPPIAVADSFTVDVEQQTELALIQNDAEPDGTLDVSLIRIVADPGAGDLSFGPSGNVFYTTSDTSVTTDEFSYQLVDSDGLASEVVTVRLSINQAPTDIKIDNSSVDENAAAGTLVGTVSATDLNDDIVSYSLLDNGAGPFQINSSTGAITVANSELLDFETTTTFEQSVSVLDATGLQSVRNFTITVNPIDEAPEANEASRTVVEGGSVFGDLNDLVSDPESQIDSFNIISRPDHGEITLRPDGQWEYVHDDTENFVDSFTYEVVDAGGNVATSTINIVVTPIDDVPVAVEDSFTVNSTTNLVVSQADLLGNDTNVNLNADIEIIQGPENGRLVREADGRIRYIPDLAFDGVDSFEYRVRVNDQVSSSALVAIEVNAVSVAPVIEVPTTPPAEEVEENEEVEDEIEEENEEDDSEFLMGPIEEANRIEQTLTNEAEAVGPQEEFLIKRSSLAQDAIDSNQRQLLWQPRYASYGDQTTVNTRLAGGSAFSHHAALSELEEDSLRHVLAGEFSSEMESQFELPVEFADIPLLTFSASSFLTVGYLVWAVRAGALVSTFISMPAWTQFDPLPVIEKGIPVNLGDEDDSLEKLVDTA